MLVAPTLVQHPAVRYLVGERMLERVFEVGKQARFIQELACLQFGQSALQLVLRRFCDGSEKRVRHVLTNDCGCLQKALVRRYEPIDARSKNRLTVAGTWTLATGVTSGYAPGRWLSGYR